MSSGLIINMAPFWSAWTAWEGMTRASGLILSWTTTLTNCPGQSVSSWFGKVALADSVPDWESIAFSTKVTWPLAVTPWAPGIVAVTGSGSAAIAFCSSAR